MIVVGPPGSGKTELARQLRSRGVAVADSGDSFVELTGSTPAEVAIYQGPAALRDASQRAGEVALDAAADVVVIESGALGESDADQTPVSQRIAERVAAGETKVFLDAPSKVLMNRSGLDAPRSVAIGSPRSSFLTMLKSRYPLYAKDAVVVDTDANSPDEVADIVTQLLREASQ